jgi:lysophospholipase L1-like esterase
MLATHAYERGVSLRMLCGLLALTACTDAAEPAIEQHAQEEAAGRAAAPAAMVEQRGSSGSSGDVAGVRTPAAVGGSGGAAGAGGVGGALAGAGASAAEAGKDSPPATAGHAVMTGSSGKDASTIMASAGAGAIGFEPASCKRASSDSSTPVVYVIGDSTASVYEANLYPRTGWAQPLQNYFPPACAKVQDKALSGRSSKSFLEEGAWTPINGALHAGDFVLIQFGHNDEKREDTARFTEPFDSFQRYLSTYIDDTLKAGATPILLTPIERNNWSDGKLKSTHGDYPEAVRKLGEMRKLTVVDMTQLTHAYLERLGQQASTELFMNLAAGESPNYPSGNSDNTHLQEKGARAVADLALAELARQRTALATLLRQVPNP